MSLRLQLTLFFTAVLAASLLAFSALLYVLLERSLALDVDQVLASKAEDIARTSRLQNESAPRSRRIRLPYIDAFATSDIYIQLLDASGQLVERTGNLGDDALPRTEAALAHGRQGEPWYESLVIDGEPLRIYTAPLLVDGQTVGFIQVGRSVQDEEHALARVQRLLLFCDALVVIAAAAVGWVLARASLRPIDRVTQAARAIGLSGRLDRRLDPVNRHDEVGRLVATFNDMLDRLETAFLAQRRFVADASHELRTPLTTIRGNAELLRRAPDLPRGDVDEALADIASEAQRMSRLVTELLQLARADAGQQLERAPVRVDELVLDVVRQMQPHKPAVTLATGPVTAGLVQGSQDALKELLLILVDNALKYTPPGGHVQVGVQRDGGFLVIRVTDDGIGIDPADLPHIFERFYRATHVRQQGGTGLGLAIARWIAERHQGRITVDSTPGKGSTFSVWLPALHQPFPSAPGPPVGEAVNLAPAETS
jgi:heavy metal sensor kinase